MEVNYKLLSILILGIFLISFASAFDFDNVKIYNKDIGDYGKVEIKNSVLGIPFFETNKLIDLELIENTESCSDNCSAIKEIVMYEDGQLIQDVRFIKIENSELTEEVNIEEYNFYIQDGFNLVIEKKEFCEDKVWKNGSIGKFCELKNIEVEQPIWKKYNYEKVSGSEEGKIYLIKLEGKKKKYETLDWQIKSAGVWIDDWAVWGSISNNEAHGLTFDGTESTGAARAGMRIGTKGTLINIVNINKSATSDASKAYITDASKVVLASANFSGTIATFIPSFPLSTHTTYYLLVDKGGATYTSHFKSSGVTYPIDETYINWTGGVNTGGGDASTQAFNVISTLIEYQGGNVTILTPSNNQGFMSQIVNFNGSASITGVNIVNMSVKTNITGVLIPSNSTTGLSSPNASLNLTVTFPSDGLYQFTIEACSDDGTCGTAENRTLTIDSSSPTINSIYPNTTINYHTLGNNLTLNYSITETNPSKAVFSYNGVNYTFTGTTNSSSFPVVSGLNNGTWYFNDTSGNLKTEIARWGYKIFQNSETHSATIFETESETYSINITANSSFTGIKLNWNATNYSLSNQGGGLWTYSRDTPIGNGTMNMSYFFTYAESIIESTNYTQFVNFTYFTPYINGSAYTDIFLNISFKDENSLINVNASIPLSIFDYYLGSGSINKSLSFSNITNNFNYVFAGTTGGKLLKVLPNIQFRQVSDYPQRIWIPGIKNYNSTDTNQILYLLSSADGLYVTYQVLDSDGNQLADVDVAASRIVGEEVVIVGTGQTDSAGAVTFWMNPDFLQTIVFSKIGYTTFTLNHFPTQSTYTLTMGSLTSSAISDYLRGITYSISPRLGTTIRSNTITNFNLTFDSSYWSLDSFGFNIYGDGVLINVNSSTNSSGGFIHVNQNTGTYDHITINYYWNINGTTTDGTSGGWFVFDYNNTNWSISNLITDINSAVDEEIFGLTQTNLNFIIFIVIFLITGISSYKFSINSPSAIIGIIFGLVFLLDYALGLIDIGIGVDYFPTIFTGLALVASIFMEVNR